jgi:hypothetical protein
MDERPRPAGGSGWTLGKVVGVVMGLLGMVGAGVCSLCGFAYIESSHSDTSIFWVLTLLGVLLTALNGWRVITIFRKVREERDRDNS